MRTTLFFVTTVAVTLAGFCANASAEETVELEKLVVTAAMHPIAVDEVAGSVTIITAEDIKRQQAMFLGDVLRSVPGFAVSQSGGPGAQTQIRVRGSEANHVLVLIDGIRVNDPASADEFQFQYALGSNIERIEILRGPMSATWGTNALSAVVNIIQKQPDRPAHLGTTVEAGSWDSRSFSLNGSLGSDRLRAWTGISFMDTSGINIARIGTERDGTENTSFNAGLDFDVNEMLSFGMLGRHVEVDTEFDDIDFFETGLPVDADRLTEASRSYLQGELRLNPANSKWNGSVTFNAVDTENQNYSDGSWSSGTAADTLEFRARASVLLGDNERQSHRVTFTLDRLDTDFEQRGLASAFGDPNQDQSYDVTGWAIEYFSRPSEGFSWSVSGRVDDFSDFDDARTWQVASSYKLTDSFRLKGSIGTGSKAPTFTERFGFFDGSFVGNPGLKPETSSGWELGVDANLLSGAARLQFAWFDRELEDEIDGFVFDPGSGLFTAANKISPSDRRGFEISVDALVTDQFSLGLNYSHVDASEIDFAGNEVPEVRRPENMASLNANYRFGNDRGNLNLSVNHNGDQFDLFFSPQTFFSERVLLESYSLVDLAFSWRLNVSLELTVRAENLFDKGYEEILGFSRPGRAVFAGLRGYFRHGGK